MRGEVKGVIFRSELFNCSDLNLESACAHVPVSMVSFTDVWPTANERTFLGYLRTSITLSMMGIFLAQLWTLEHTLNPSEVFGYFILSKPLALIFQSAALCLTIIGTIRFWRQQSAMAIGKVHAGGWEITTTAAGSFLVGEVKG